MSSDAAIAEAIEAFIKQDPDTQEDNIITELVALEVKTGLKYEKKSNGMIRILKNKANGRYRIVMRANKTYEPLLNHFVLPFLKIADSECSYKVDDYATGSMKKMDIRIVFPPSRAKSMETFREKFLEAQKGNEAILNKPK